MKFIDRTDEQTFLKKIIEDIIEGKETCIWIEGKSGSGKSYFMKYMEKNLDIPLFCYEDEQWLYKCNETDIDKEFQLFVEIICSLQLRHPKEFNSFLTKYFQNICDVSWLEALALILPNIKATEWAKDLINKPLEQIQNAKAEISNKLYQQGLKKCLAKLVVYMLEEVEKHTEIVFCIDDACWMDYNSICALKLLLNIASIEKKIKISLIILTRSKEELVLGKENYCFLENSLKEVYEDIQYIKIKNFDYSTTHEYIKLMNRNFVKEVTHNIYKVTGGNPQELFQALKFNDSDLQEVVYDRAELINDKYISAELIIKLETDNSYALPILSSISLFHQEMQLDWLAIITKNLCTQILEEEFNTVKYDECIKLLIDKELIKIKTNTIVLVHDSTKETSIEYLKNNGEYALYMNCIVETILNNLGLRNILLKEVLYLYNEFNPTKGFEIFLANYKTNNSFLEGNIIKLVAQSISKELSLYTAENIENYIVPIILEKCVLLAYYDLAYSICIKIYSYQKELSMHTRYRYLINFSKILIDKGMLQKNDKFNALGILDEIFELSKLSSSEKIETYLITMSAYEHILDFENINKYNNFAKQIFEREHINALYNAMFLRNQGLVFSHCDLKKQYIEAIEYSKKIENECEKKLMLGTCYNNLGLHYLYVGNINDALENFQYANKYLEEIGYDTFRILNNIAICYLIINKYEQAYTYLLQAKALNICCIFEKLCIQSNLSILEYKLGQCEIAKQMASSIIEEYEHGTKKTVDDLVYSSAMANRGYFYYIEKDYANACKLYKESMFFQYRYNDDLQKKKRQEMIKICLSHLGVIEKKETDIDIADTQQSIFGKMYAPIAFAYYII